MAGKQTVLDILLKAVDQTGPGVASAKGNISSLVQPAGALGAAMKLAGLAVGGLTVALAARKFAQALGDSANRMSDLTDMSTRLAESAPKIERWIAAGAQVGVDAGQIEGAMRFMSRAIAEADEGTEEYAKTFRRLGINIRAGNGQLIDASEGTLLLADALQSVDSQAERTRIQMQLLGRGGTTFGALIAGGREEFEKLLEAQGRYGTITQRMLERGDQLDDSIASNRRAWTILKDTILTDLGPAFATILDQTSVFLGFMSRVIQGAQESGDAVAKALGLDNPLVQKILKSGVFGLAGLAFVDQERGAGSGAGSGSAGPPMPTKEGIEAWAELGRKATEATRKAREEAARDAAQIAKEELAIAQRLGDDISKSWQLAESRKSRIAADGRERELSANREWLANFSAQLDEWAAQEAEAVSEFAGRATAQSQAWVDALFEFGEGARITAAEGIQMLGQGIDQFSSSLGNAVVDAKNFHDHMVGFLKSIIAQLVATIAKVILLRLALNFIPGGNVVGKFLGFSQGGIVRGAASGLMVPGTIGRDSTLIAASGGEAVLPEGITTALRSVLREPSRVPQRTPARTTISGGTVKVELPWRQLRPMSRAETLALFDLTVTASLAAERGR